MTEDSRADYVRAVLAAYVALADTPDRPRPADRSLAAQLHDREIPLQLVRDALILTHARRTLRPPEAPPLPSGHFLLPACH